NPLSVPNVTDYMPIELIKIVAPTGNVAIQPIDLVSLLLQPLGQ
ncbi:unnamed protein product, partial [marine sediment metagenome]